MLKKLSIATSRFPSTLMVMAQVLSAAFVWLPIGTELWRAKGGKLSDFGMLAINLNVSGKGPSLCCAPCMLGMRHLNAGAPK